MADTDKLVKVGQLDTIVDEIVDKFGETNGRLSTLTNVVGRNLVGKEPKTKYPVRLCAGDKITISMSDNSTGNIITFYTYGADGTQTHYWFAPQDSNQARVIEMLDDVYFISWEYSSSSMTAYPMIEIGEVATGYADWIPSVSYVSGRLDQMDNSLGLLETATLELVSPYNERDGYINERGSVTNSDSFKVLIYKVVPGDVILLDIQYPFASSGGVYQFQSAEATPYPNTNIIGGTQPKAYSGLLTVPEGAFYLLATIKTGVTVCTVRNASSLKGKINELLSEKSYDAVLSQIGAENRKRFNAKSGDYIVISTEDNSGFAGNIIRFTDINYNSVAYWTLSIATSPLFVQIPAERNDIYYCHIEGGSDKATHVVNYSGLSLDELAHIVMSSMDNIYKVNVTEANRMTPFHIRYDDYVRVETSDGKNFPTMQMIVYGQNAERLGTYELNANYGNRRVFRSTGSGLSTSDGYYIRFTESCDVVLTNFSLSDKIKIDGCSAGVVAKYVNDSTYNDRKNVEQFSDNKFVFFADAHASNSNVKRIFEFTNAVGGVDAVINGGDLVGNLMTEDVTWYDDLVDTCDTDVLMCIGNHDGWIEPWTTTSNPKDIYDKFIAPVADKVDDIVQPQSAETNGLCYYYKDYGTIRVIVLAAMSLGFSNVLWNSEQLSWLSSVLSDAITNDKSVICVNHAPFSKATSVIDYDLPLNSWQKYSTWPSMDNGRLNEEAVAAVNSFISNGGKFICWLAGHEHRDFLMTENVYHNQVLINIASARYNYRHDGVNAQSQFETNYDAFNYIGIDTANKIIKVWRVGYNQDAAMKVRNRFSYDYGNMKLLSYS